MKPFAIEGRPKGTTEWLWCWSRDWLPFAVSTLIRYRRADPKSEYRIEPRSK